MPWFKIDDGFWSHPKTLQLSDGAQALWMRAGSWSMHHLTDGFIPDFALPILSAKPRYVNELRSVSLWFSVKDGNQFHDWDKYQPTREQVEADRRDAADRKRKSRERSQRPSRVTDSEVTGVDTPTPTRPDPTRPVIASNEARDVAEIRPDVSRLCNLLADLIEGNGSKRPTIGKGWHDSARLMIDADKRPLAECVTLIQWCQQDSFWRGNILSMPKFRDKYDTLRLQRETKMKAASPEPTRAPRRVVSGRVQ